MIKDCPEKREGFSASVILKETAITEVNKQSPLHRCRNLAADQISEELNVPISKGKVNGDVLAMRDSGFSFAAVSAKYVRPDQYLDEYEDILLMDCTPRTFQKAKIEVETKYFAGQLVVFVVENPVVDLIFGNVTKCVRPTEDEQLGNIPDTNEGHHQEHSGKIETVSKEPEYQRGVPDQNKRQEQQGGLSEELEES